MSRYYEKCIRPRLTELMKRIDVTDHQMLSFMNQEKMLSDDDQHNLESTSLMRPSEKDNLFFHTILRTGLATETQFRAFCAALTKRRGAEKDDLAQSLLKDADFESESASPTSFERKPNPKELNNLSKLIASDDMWKPLGRCLDVPDSKLTEIAATHHSPRERAYQMLQSWVKKNSNAATVKLLCEALCEESRDDTAKEIFGW